ncbi:glycosyltransferase family 2 protein [Shinella zoogloeoides]
MARVTVGIPVYNGAPMLRECLDSLLAQTYQDFIIVIADNASTDETPDICAEYAAKDSRIEVIRQEENIGSLPNFEFLVRRANTEMFMWRADDDYSDENFIEELIGSLDDNPDAILAIPRIITRRSIIEYTEESVFGIIEESDFVDGLIKRFYSYHVSAFYGLWRTAAIQDIVKRVWTAYPEAYAGDHLTLLPVFLKDAAIGNDRTLFVQRTYSPVKGNGLRGERTLSNRIAMLEHLMPLFYACYDAEVKACGFPTNQERRILAQRKRFTYHKLRASPWRIFRLKIKKMVGKKF